MARRWSAVGRASPGPMTRRRIVPCPTSGATLIERPWRRQTVEVAPEGRPVPGERRQGEGGGVDDVLAPVRRERGRTRPAVAHDLQREALVDLAVGRRQPGEDEVGVRVHVDEPGRDHVAGGVDHPGRAGVGQELDGLRCGLPRWPRRPAGRAGRSRRSRSRPGSGCRAWRLRPRPPAAHAWYAAPAAPWHSLATRRPLLSPDPEPPLTTATTMNRQQPLSPLHRIPDHERRQRSIRLSGDRTVDHLGRPTVDQVSADRTGRSGLERPDKSIRLSGRMGSA